MWSMTWCQRVIDWDEHIRRGARYNHICSSLLDHKNSLWLRVQRSAWVPENSNDSGGRGLSVLSGRTGTRLNIGRPQVRWDEGVANARGSWRQERNPCPVETLCLSALSYLKHVCRPGLLRNSTVNQTIRKHLVMVALAKVLTMLLELCLVDD